ncbi:hypothetical protein LRP52_11960 [Photobacterium sp. ZSDE20]|uniref:Lipoprotein n=1 Tax=Photobacterium pectinilyticum TaxID=2906793 RepID=A0ABT1N0C8_9GAMM|nr:hypothetical protein [Photobacterium sp. ZSDE20]MCQ1058188.1 hypothetical protein [Photobacterium sp. ZSDE20]MDD1822911.1 hypothetical protein [Photobacterium sp. ZSDE20]
MKKFLLSIGLVVLMTGCVGKADSYYSWINFGFIESYELPDSVAAVEGYDIKASIRVLYDLTGLDSAKQEDRLWILKKKYHNECADIEIVNEIFVPPRTQALDENGIYKMDVKCL